MEPKGNTKIFGAENKLEYFLFTMHETCPCPVTFPLKKFGTLKYVVNKPHISCFMANATGGMTFPLCECHCDKGA